MNKTQIIIGSNYMDFVYKFHRTMLEQRLTLVYEGPVNQALTKSFTALAEFDMNKTEDTTTTKMRVYHVMVECLQNICKHSDESVYDSDDPEGDTEAIAGSGIFLVSKSNEEYTVTSGNLVSVEKEKDITELLNSLNKMDKDELKALYKKKLLENRLTEKGGAGLGLIDMAKKTGSKFDYHFESINDKKSFFILKIKIKRDNIN